MENHFVKITNKTFAVIFTVMFVCTIIGIVTKGALWHIPSLIITGLLAFVFWLEKDDDPLIDNTKEE